MNKEKLKIELKKLLFDYDLYRKQDLEACEETQMPLSYLGVYVLNWGKVDNPEIGFFEVDVDNLIEEIISLVEEENNK